MKRLIFLLTCIMAIGIGSCVRAEITSWVDENGVKHFSDKPAPAGVESESKPEIITPEWEIEQMEAEEEENERQGPTEWDMLIRSEVENRIAREEEEQSEARYQYELELEREHIRALNRIADTNEERDYQTYILRPSGPGRWRLDPE